MTNYTDQRDFGQCAATTSSGRQCSREGRWRTTVYLCNQHHHALEEEILDAYRTRAAERWHQPLQAGVVYYVQDRGGLIKIGTSTQLSKRLTTLRREHGPLELLATHPGGYEAEQAMHAQFADSRVFGEWFVPSDELAEHIEALTERYSARAS